MFDIFSIANKSIAGIFWAVILIFLLPFIFKKRKPWVTILLIVLTLIIATLLITSNSRAGWLACAVGVAFIWYPHVTIKSRKIALITATLFLLIFFLLLLFYKADSSSGRKHIYNISFRMLKDSWISGIGVGKFKTQFNEYQAEYFFANNINSKRALLADNTFYAFNDYLQWFIETGIFGLLILVLLLYLTLNRIIYLRRESGNKTILIAVVAALICTAIAALFSYPFQVVAIQAVVLVCLGIIAFYPSLNDSNSIKGRIVIFIYRGLIIALTVFFVNNTWKVADRKEMEKEAFAAARSGYKTKAIQQYKQLVEKYPGTGYNWFSYAQQLYYSNRLIEAIESLNNCRLYYVDNKIYKLKADIELELKMYDAAEKDYLRTIYMVPNRMESRFDLLKYYIVRKDSAKAVYWAKSILNMPVKVPSPKVDNMLRETKIILDKLEK